MKASEEFEALLHSDADEVLARTTEYDARMRVRLLRTTSAKLEHLNLQRDRAKAVWISQALLSSLDDSSLPYSTGSQLATHLSSIIHASKEDAEIQGSALNSLALIFVKSAQITDSLDATIRMAFLTALKSYDKEIREFASEALSGEGLLARRPAHGITVFLSFSYPPDASASSIEALVKQLAAYTISARRVAKRKVVTRRKSTSRPLRHSRQTSRHR